MKVELNEVETATVSLAVGTILGCRELITMITSKQASEAELDLLFKLLEEVHHKCNTALGR